MSDQKGFEMSVVLTVIIPVYNVERYLRECLDSVVNQTYGDLEIICVNDGSTVILEEYAKRDCRIRVIDKGNGGLSSARNAGLDVATGEYIAFLDSDDYLALNTYETAMHHVSDVDFVCFGAELFGEGYVADRGRNSFMPSFSGLKKLSAGVLRKTSVTVWNKIFKREIIERYRIRFPQGMQHEDTPFCYCYEFCSRSAYYIREGLYFYRQRADSIMGLNAHAIDQLHNFRCVHDFVFKHGFCTWRNRKLLIKIFRKLFNFAYTRSCDEDKSAVVKAGVKQVNEFWNDVNSGSAFIEHLKVGRVKLKLSFWEKIWELLCGNSLWTIRKNKSVLKFS